VMLAVALMIGQMTAGLRYQARVATLREARVRALYEMSRDLSGVLTAEQVADVAARFAASELDARAALLVADLQGRIGTAVAPATIASSLDTALAQWVFD